MTNIYCSKLVVYQLTLLLAAEFMVCNTSRLSNFLKVESILSKITSTESSRDFCLSFEQKNKLIHTKSSTSEKWQSYFRVGSDKQKLDEKGCKEALETQFNDLKNVVNSGGSDFCADDKITKIEQFHNDYVEPGQKHHEQKKSNRYHPGSFVLNNYFVMYASEVSAICEEGASKNFGLFMDYVDKSFIEDLERDVGTDLEKFKSTDLKKTLKQLDKLDTFLISLSKIFSISMKPNYEDIFIPWNLIKILQRDKELQLDQVYNFDNNKLSVRMKKAKDIQRLQNFCKNYAKPTYTGSLLPVMRLVHLGYYPRSSQLIEKIAGSKWAGRQYMFVQLCELVMPLNAVPDEKLDTYEIIFVKREDLPSQSDVTHEEDTGSNSLNEAEKCYLDDPSYDGSPFLEPEDSLTVHRIKSDIWKRAKRMESLLWILLARINRYFSLKDLSDMLSKKNKIQKNTDKQESSRSKLGNLSKSVFWKVIYYVGLKFFVNITVKSLTASVVIYNKLFYKSYVKFYNIVMSGQSKEDA